MLNRLARWAISKINPLVNETPDLDGSAAITPDPPEDVAAEWKRRALVAERRARELFEACEGFEQQRDQWIKLYHQQAREHTAAQVTMSGVIEQQRVMMASAIKLVNSMRADQKLEPLQLPPRGRALDGTMIQLPEEFVARQRALIEEAKRIFQDRETVRASSSSDPEEGVLEPHELKV